ncbi:MAG: shikimate dehydrogenase [Boseongicola sp. SB0675_bin_26]|nr:shikimate dehydrogenase [Boseongicola sp. SB0675_bin_26]
MTSQDRIPLAGVIGTPVAHSKSPRIFRHWLTRFGIQGHYIPMDVAEQDLETAIRALPRLGFVGVNVTIPHKEHVLEVADVVSDRAALTGSANTLAFRDDGMVHADSTDGHGFMESLRSSAPGWSPGQGPVAILGAGGAARAVVASLLNAGAEEIRLSNRTRARSEILRKEFGAKIRVHDWSKAGDMLKGARTVVNATSLGMVGHDKLQVPLRHLSGDAVVTDLVYAPLETEFLAQARRIGCQPVDGLGMLLFQAAPGFERWFGIAPHVDDQLRQAVLS